MKKIFILLMGFILISCSSSNNNVKIDDQDSTKIVKKLTKDSYKATGYNERIQYIIVHYTAIGRDISIRALTGPKVSSHYLITDEKNDPVFQLVDDNKRAWHAGKSAFHNRENLNDTSIGIEIVNLGYNKVGNRKTPNSMPVYDKNLKIKHYIEFIPFKEHQIKDVAKLIQNLSVKYKVSPTHILGHSDIAPTRKEDPGALFPWERLYNEYRIGTWYDQNTVNKYLKKENYKTYSTREIQQEFEKFGYPMPISGVWDYEGVRTVQAFQLHYRPDNADGIVDNETFAILQALNKKYN